jgi:hypothetical protein
VITTVVTVFVLDNFFDVLRTGSQFLLESKAMPDSVRDRNWVLPSKDAMPLGLGSGKITGTVVAGLGRLVNVDTERECECEAAALFCAYSLGLPCFAFRPNALEVSNATQRNATNQHSIMLIPQTGTLIVLFIVYSHVLMCCLSRIHIIYYMG